MKILTKACILLPLLMLIGCFGGKKDDSGRLRRQPLQAGEIRTYTQAEAQIIFIKSDEDSVDAGIYLMGGGGDAPAGIERFILSSSMEKMAGSLNASLTVERDYVGISIRSDSAAFPDDWNQLIAIFFNEEFDSLTVDRAREKLFTSLAVEEKDFQSRIRSEQEKEFFEFTSYAKNPQGTSDSFSRMMPDDLQRYHSDSFGTSRIKVIVKGSLNFWAVQRLTQGSFISRMIGDYLRETLPVPPNAQTARKTIRESESDISYISLLIHVPDMLSVDYNAMRVAAALLQKRVFTYSLTDSLIIDVNVELRHDRSNSLAIAITTKDAPKHYAALLEEINKLKSVAVSIEEIGAVVREFDGKESEELQCAYEMSGGSLADYPQLDANLVAVTPDLVMLAAQTYFKNLNLYVVVPDGAATDKFTVY